MSSYRFWFRQNGEIVYPIEMETLEMIEIMERWERETSLDETVNSWRAGWRKKFMLELKRRGIE